MIRPQKILAIVFVASALPLLFADEPIAVNPDSDQPLETRLQRERRVQAEGLALLPHRFNYFLPLAYNTRPNRELYESVNQRDLDRLEAKFQLSIKVLLADGVIRHKGQLYFGYTQLSFWQIYNRNYSSPFRETNYEPELFLTFDTDRWVGNTRLRQIEFAVSHESNGRTEPLSRSWNRVYANLHFDRKRWIFLVRPWIRLPDIGGHDDNPDIHKYMGYGEYGVAYSRREQTISMLLRNNFDFEENRGAVELNYKFSLTEHFSGLFQYFNGYGESLADYNHRNQRVSVGLALSHWNW